MRYNWHSVDVRIYAVAVSVLISLFTITLPDTPNDDAFIYIRTAEIFLTDGLLAAFGHYAWAGYSILIALISKLGLSLLTSAFVVNALFYALLVYSFISIISFIDSSRLVLVMAALCVLLYPQLNEYRYLIIRDVGFWALALFSLWQLLGYIRIGTRRYAVGFCCGLVAAAAFRAEALAYLLITPLVLLCNRGWAPAERRRRFLEVVLPAGILLLIVLAMAALAGLDVPALFTNLAAVYEPFINTSLGSGAAGPAGIGTALFGEYAANYSEEYLWLFITAGLFAILCANLFNAVGGPFFWLLIYGWLKRHISIDRQAALPILTFLVINAAILFAFLFITRFLTSRYAMLFALLVVLAVPLVLARLLESLRGKHYEQVALRVLILFFGYCGFDSFISFGESKQYVFDSVEWIVQQGGTGSDLVTNNHSIAYFSNRVDAYDQVQRLLSAEQIRMAEAGDIVALEMHDQMRELVQGAEVRPLLELQVAFPSIEDQRVSIFRRVAP